jgi:hypothetical protein
MDGRTIIDTLFSMQQPLGRPVMQRPSSTIILLQPFSASTLVTGSGSGAFIAKVDRDASTAAGGLGAATGTVSLYGSNGRRLYTTAGPMRASKLDARVVAFVVDTVLAVINRGRTGSVRITAEKYRRTLATPPFLPLAEGAVVGTDGSFLVRDWSASRADGANYVVLNARGEPHGFLGVAVSVRVLAADANEVVLLRELPDGGDLELMRSRWETPPQP